MKTEKQIHKRFERDVLPTLELFEATNETVDKPRRREAFCIFLDNLVRDGVIIAELAEDVDQPEFCK